MYNHIFTADIKCIKVIYDDSLFNQFKVRILINETKFHYVIRDTAARKVMCGKSNQTTLTKRCYSLRDSLHHYIITQIAIMMHNCLTLVTTVMRYVILNYYSHHYQTLYYRLHN